MTSVTIVLRSKNEEQWIGSTLQAISHQEGITPEIILVDNGSTDNTVPIFKQLCPQGAIVIIDEFFPGKAINMGIRAGGGDIIIILSSHCIPVNSNWLQALIQPLLDDERIGAVYGRQIPMRGSSALDKRDLLNTFGIEERVQKKDSFFHNANSAIRRSLWEMFPFSDEVKHIEDRIWARQIVDSGHWIYYSPEACVYHHHGIYHHDNIKRAEVISDILTQNTLVDDYSNSKFFSADSFQTLFCLLGHTEKTHVRLLEILCGIQKCASKKQIVVYSDEPSLIDTSSGVEVVKKDSLGKNHTFVDVLSLLLNRVSAGGFYPDAVFYINLKLENSSPANISKLEAAFYDGVYDSVFYGVHEYDNVWVERDCGYEQLAINNYLPRAEKHPIFLSKYGLGTITRPKFVREKSLVGKKIAIVDLKERGM